MNEILIQTANLRKPSERPRSKVAGRVISTGGLPRPGDSIPVPPAPVQLASFALEERIAEKNPELVERLRMLKTISAEATDKELRPVFEIVEKRRAARPKEIALVCTNCRKVMRRVSYETYRRYAESRIPMACPACNFQRLKDGGVVREMSTAEVAAYDAELAESFKRDSQRRKELERVASIARRAVREELGR
ncbi:MAG: hypothetical protein JW793_10475 [Acidobacteria bacterium]|nr:hypothetical protein [Acidobacteriota bacterium]